MTRRTNAPLGPTQKRVLLTLADGQERAAVDHHAWYPLSENQIVKAMLRLGRRSLVDMAGFYQYGNGRARTYKITEAGREALRGIDPELIDEPETHGPKPDPS